MMKQERTVKKIAVTSGAALISKAKSAPAKKDELYDLYTMCAELNTTNSMNGKLEILKKYPQCKQLLTYTYDPFRQYYVSSANLQKRQDLVEYTKFSLIEILDKLANREVTGHKAIALVNGYVFANLQYQELIYNIFKRNLKTRVDSSLINRIWPGTVPAFDVALAYNYEHRKDKVDFTKQKWFASRKLDGCVSGDSIVEFEDGSKSTMREVVEGRINRKIKSYNDVTKKIEYKEITAYVKNGDDIQEKGYQWYEIVLENGVNLKLTGNHRVYLPELKCYRRVDELEGSEELLLDI
jgi:hypothetical protein